VVVIGVGSIGLLCLLLARAAGAGCLIAVDSSEYAREQALRLGADHALHPAEARRRVYEIIPRGPDLIVEAAGPIDGGRTHFLEGRMDASFGTTPLAMQRAIDLMECGLVDPEATISHRFPLERIGEAIDVMGTTRRNKIVIKPQD
jgi:threonine dehydrogenase-like Zn-dependent dehydrogenase